MEEITTFEQLQNLWQLYYKQIGTALFAIPFLAIIAIAGQWSLYVKARQPGVACIVPVWNVMIFMKIVGRPQWQSLIVMIPPIFFTLSFIFINDIAMKYIVTGLFLIPWIVFMSIIYIEVCKSFGKTSIVDYVLVILFNGLYLLNLGLSYESNYYGPYYKLKKEGNLHPKMK